MIRSNDRMLMVSPMIRQPCRHFTQPQHHQRPSIHCSAHREYLRTNHPSVAVNEASTNSSTELESMDVQLPPGEDNFQSRAPSPIKTQTIRSMWKTRHFSRHALAMMFLWLMNSPAARGQNFLSTDVEAHRVAESSRRVSAEYWTGRPLPGSWSAPCPIIWAEQLGPASGLTRFQFDRGEVSGWQMTLRGDRRSVLNDVIPHEVDHTVRASLCRRPVPRWLDEGCASLFESAASHEALRRQRQRNLAYTISEATIDQLNYPTSSEEIASLYAEGFSLVEFLLSHSTPQALLRVQRSTAPPSRSISEVYQVEVSRLLNDWHAWEARRYARGTQCDCVGCPWHATPDRDQKLSSGNAPPATAIDRRPVLTIWTATWCLPCQRFHQDLSRDPSFRDRLHSRFRVTLRDFDQHRTEARRAGVSAVPLFEVDRHRIEGYLGQDWLLRQLDSADPPLIPRSDPRSDTSRSPSGSKSVTLPASPPTSKSPSTEVPVEPSARVQPSLRSTPRTAPADAKENLHDASGTLDVRRDHRLEEFFAKLVPVMIPVLTSLGVIGGTAVSGGVGGIALAVIIRVLWRRATRSRDIETTISEGGVSGPTRAPFPRKLDEASELLGLRRSEGRVATLDTLRGMFLDDELEKLSQTGDSSTASVVRQIRQAVDQRVDEVAPLTTKL